MSPLIAIICLSGVYCGLRLKFRIPNQRGWCLAFVCGLGLFFFGRHYFGTPFPGTWLERANYGAVVTLHKKMVKSPFAEQITVGIVKSTYTSGGDLLGPMIRNYRLVQFGEDKVDGLVIVHLDKSVTIFDKNQIPWQVRLLPGNPQVTIPEREG